MRPKTAPARRPSIPTSDLHADRDGRAYYFGSDRCLQEFLHAPAGATVWRPSGGR